MKIILQLTFAFFLTFFTLLVNAQTSNEKFTTSKNKKFTSPNQVFQQNNSANYIYSNKNNLNLDRNLQEYVLELCNGDIPKTRYVIQKIRIQFGKNTIKNILPDDQYEALDLQTQTHYLSETTTQNLINDLIDNNTP